MSEKDLWNVERVTADAYRLLVPDRKNFFNEPSFTQLNMDKVDSLHYLVIKKRESPRFAVIIGQVDKTGKCPFSAPYSYPVSIREDAVVRDYDLALSAIETYCLDNGMESIKFVFPPLIYDESCLSTWISCLYRAGYTALHMDINYTLDLNRLNQKDYEMLVSSKGRKHLRKAVKLGIAIIHCDTEELEKEAYKIIVDNHSAKGRPTHLSFEQLQDTFALVHHDTFLARLNGEGIASMIYYQITKEIVQCIYSGYRLEYSNSGVMNYLSWYAIRHYGDRGFRYIDRATATEDSVPNYGLCDFKDSIGGKRSLKYTFIKELRVQRAMEDFYKSFE